MDWNGKNCTFRRQPRPLEQMQTPANARRRRRTRVSRTNLLTMGWDPYAPAWLENEIVCTGRPCIKSRSVAGRSQSAARYKRYVGTAIHRLLNAFPKLLHQQRYRKPKQCRFRWQAVHAAITRSGKCWTVASIIRALEADDKEKKSHV